MRCRKCEPVPEEVQAIATILERRWTLSLLVASHSGATRFNEFLEAVGRIPPGTLSTRLGELEAAGILRREVVDSRPPHVEYRLTEHGRALQHLVVALQRWAASAVR
jgi:DNA-binding HxlR family transcriptional regulator